MATDIQEFQLPAEYYARFTLNKKGKLLLLQEKEYFSYVPDFWSARMEVALYVERNQRYKELQTNYNRIMELAKELNRGFKIEEGSISIIQKKAKYDEEGLLSYLGEREFLNNVTVNMEKLNDLVKLGILPKGIEKPFIQVKDIKVDLHVQSLDSEAKMYQALM
ncbi:hypothetical protein ACQKMI_24475 [Lysinibacillus sp. NPDC097214]|uniref:hypothetical protein n=1 Tax=Lysinibacillus sp. NPDC097214 TaxID=3390584 RepID=UPI003D039F72